MRAVLKSFAGRRVLVTGHTGFKGSWLAFILAEAGAEVMGYALPPAESRSHFEMLGLEKKLKHVVGDVRDGAGLGEAVRAFKPEFVFHLAAQALVKLSYSEPVETFATNIMGSVHLLDAVRKCETVRSLVYVTSDKCYENVEWVWGYRETDRLGGRDPYSASKAGAEIVFSAFSSSFFAGRKNFGATTARAGNVIGGGDWAVDRIVPDCVRAAESDGVIELRHPSATRPWQHVLEPLSGYLLLASRAHGSSEFDGAWNFGPSTSEVRTVRDVAEFIVGELGSGRVEVAEERPSQHEARLLQLNCDKAHQLLNWHPRWSVEQALTATAGWYKSVRGGTPAAEVTRAQVLEYFTEMA